ncbi:MAG TPA: MFS transporter [Rhizomicrobium sp.]|jgi:MFS family permease|nr:MFS transporter [Rhizomicrobium sp.]
MDRQFDKRSAFAFIVAFGIVSLFADMAYEGMRGLNGPFLATLGASGAAVGVIAGGGELAGYLIRLVSGRVAQRTGAYWPLAIGGYALTMAAVPAMAFAFNWQTAAVFVVLERTGKAIRSPATNTMQSRAGDLIGQGWAFGLQEALDQTGAIIGPLLTAYILARHGDYHAAYAWLGVPAILTLVTVAVIAVRYRFAGRISPGAAPATARALSRAFWLYTASAALLGFGFADFSLIAFHFTRSAIVAPALVPTFYAAAMGASALGALLFGLLFDRRGLVVLVPTVLIGACTTPLVFFGHATAALIGTILWGFAIGTQNALMSASVAKLVPESMRARAYGLFSALYGIAWFIGSALLGALYDRSLTALAAVAIASQLLALLPLGLAIRSARAAFT